ncbi:hypothetical protein V8F33_000525 [Rhypophila sp. PSN 637]
MRKSSSVPHSNLGVFLICFVSHFSFSFGQKKNTTLRYLLSPLPTVTLLPSFLSCLQFDPRSLGDNGVGNLSAHIHTHSTTGTHGCV